MKRYILFLILLISVICCTPEHVEIEISRQVPITLEACIDASESKATLEGVKVFWSEGDAIAVYDGESFSLFTLIAGAGTQHGTFSGMAMAGASSYTAVYPFSASTINDGVLDAVVPRSQWPSLDNVDPNALVMKAVASKGETLVFKNQAALLKFSVPDYVSEMLIAPVGHPFVNVVTSGGAGIYYVALTPGEYNGLSVFCSTPKNWYVKSSKNTLPAARNTITDLGGISLEKKALPISHSWQLQSFLESSSAETDLTVVLLQDIDMTDEDMRGGTYTSAADFSGSFDGCGFTVRNIDKPLFNMSHGSISNLKLEGACNSDALEFAPLVVRNYGSISGVTNKAAVSVTAKSDVEDVIVLGGIAAYSYGTISSCSNEADIEFNGSAGIAAAALGGIAGYAEAAVSDCSNNGMVKLAAPCGKKTSALGQIAVSAGNVGGIIGAAYGSAPLNGCVNSGEVVASFDAIEQSTASYARTQVGGIAGSPFGDIDKCLNHGKITAIATTSDRTALSSGNFIFDVGGISGGSITQDNGDYTKPCDNTSIVDCSNDADIVVKLDAAKSNSPVGGIAGWPNGEATGLKSKILRCINSGNITMEGSGKVRLGGIVGGTGTTEDCTNSGSITVNSANSASVIGGIAAFHSQDHGLSGCINTGDVISKVAINAAAGLIGNYGNVTLDCCAACKVDCKVENAAQDKSGTGIIVGLFNGNARNITIGTAAQPVDVAGTLIYGGQEYIVDEVSYKSLLCGSVNTSELHVFYAVCSVPHSGGGYLAEGYVKYNDGTPAAGISVSDGFNVAVTDANGYYSLLTCPDTWYIYISLPSDAVINKNDNGCPDFYTRYKTDQPRYDFTLTRQAVENEFMIFAMADPQAHSSVRGNQKKSDTNRFRDEAKPAINAQIAAQSLPCYGITLGDIVYSESSRNSNGGMTTMRTHFKGINMPVFQTMGNHDYTYFYSTSGKALTTDDTSSTLYLKAQRKFEDVFGPINLSFNRGNVHFVCMRDINYDSNTDASSYHGGFNDAQYAWLQQDLANVPKSKMIVLCVHIPLYNITGNEHVTDVINLIKQYASAKIFSGHTHYKRFYSNIKSTGVNEHIHSAVCGQWWWSNIEGDGCPNGYTIYKFSGTSIADEYFVGQNEQMNTRDYQMRIYRGNLKTGGSYAYFQWPYEAKKLMINVFNGDSRWTVKVYENGVFSGNASLMSNSKQTYSSVTAGETYTVSTASNQDWWAIGYHVGVRGRGTTGTSYYTNMFHMYTYTLKDANASVKVVATDGYGNSYECTDVISEDCWYPDYVKGVNAL